MFSGPVHGATQSASVGFPNSSGALVIDDDGHFAGVHVTAVWHRQPTSRFLDEVGASIAAVADTDVDKIWALASAPLSASSSSTTKSTSQQLASLTLALNFALRRSLGRRLSLSPSLALKFFNNWSWWSLLPAVCFALGGQEG